MSNRSMMMSAVAVPMTMARNQAKNMPWGLKIELSTSIWASSWVASSRTLVIVGMGGNSPLITVFLTKEWRFGLLLVYGWDKGSQFQIFEYLTMNHGFDLIKPMERYGLTNLRFDIKYSNIQAWANQNALHCLQAPKQLTSSISVKS